jgi:hypothetical protein
MSSTRTPGIRIDNRANCLIIDKEHRGRHTRRSIAVIPIDRADLSLNHLVRTLQ